MNGKNKTTLITGGARSGKSRHALTLAENAEQPFFIATAQALDAEMENRIEKHKKERGPRWTTIEEPLDVDKAIRDANAQNADFILLDCLTLWTANTLEHDPDSLDDRLDALIREMLNSNAPLALVTNEVGMGIVPLNKLARDFRDAAGTVNAKTADAADEVILMVAGIPMRAK